MIFFRDAPEKLSQVSRVFSKDFRIKIFLLNSSVSLKRPALVHVLGYNAACYV